MGSSCNDFSCQSLLDSVLIWSFQRTACGIVLGTSYCLQDIFFECPLMIMMMIIIMDVCKSKALSPLMFGSRNSYPHCNHLHALCPPSLFLLFVLQLLCVSVANRSEACGEDEGSA